MARFLYQDVFGFRRISRIILAAGWFIGILFGWLLYLHTDPSHVSLMRGTLGAPVSIVDLVWVFGLPFLFSVVCANCGGFVFLPVIAFMKGFVFSFVSLFLISAFGDSSWLVWPMVMFSDVFGIILLWFYWLGQADEGTVHFTGRIFASCVMFFLVCAVDYLIISPFLAGL